MTPPEEAARPRPALDVGELPGSAVDARHLTWWGNTLLLTIESMTVLLMMVTYIYLRRNFDLWPPPRVNQGLPILRPLPGLSMGTLQLVLLVVGCVGIALVDRRCRRYLRETGDTSQAPRPPRERRPEPRREAGVVVALVGLTLLGVCAVVVRFLELPRLWVRWDANAYGSAVWWVLLLHLTYLLFTTAETALAALWIGRHGLTEKLANDETLVAIAWYWTTAAWVLFYVMVYWSPRFP